MNKAQSIFASAQMYAHAARNLNFMASTDLSMLIPSMVNAALALELYFKSLYFLEMNADFKVNGRHSHDFAKLFEELPKTTQQTLIDGFNKALDDRNMEDVKTLENNPGIQIPRDLIGNLNQWSDVFTRVRYVYDFTAKSQGKQKTMMFFPEIESLLKNTLLGREPTWQSTPN